ncbi:MAG: OmpA family protein, partial [Glaciimonas sp.]|nr:OmpA family protein [Glaciimonas sp.]
YMRDILREIGPILNELPNKIALSGHTDATPYYAGEKLYSNWELSADRANASRRELIAGGMEDHKVLRVRGAASTMHMNRADPYDAVNRRISLIVLNRRSQDRIEHENDNNGNDMNREKGEPARASSLLQIKNSTADIDATPPTGIAEQMRTTLPNLDVDGTKAIIEPGSSQRSL